MQEGFNTTFLVGALENKSHTRKNEKTSRDAWGDKKQGEDGPSQREVFKDQIQQERTRKGMKEERNR